MAESVHVDRALIEENLETKALAPARNKPSYDAKGVRSTEFRNSLK